jgi:outer membrane protein insertion porin family
MTGFGRALVLVSLLLRGALALAAEAEKIVEVDVEGLRRVGREAALTGIKSKPNTAFDEDTLTKDLRTLYAKGFFRDVRVEKSHVAGGWHIVFVVEEKPSIKEIKYVGRDDISEDDIKAVVDIKPFTILNIEKLKANVEKIKDLYVGKGYYLADVHYRLQEDPNAAHEVTIIFDIVENAKVFVKQITFIGNAHIKDEELKNAIQTREGNEISFLTQSGTYKEDFFQTDIFRLQGAYYDHGYVTVKIGDPNVTISQDRRYIYIAIPISEGEQYNIGTIKFSGEVDLHDAKGNAVVDSALLQKSLTIKVDKVFNRTQLFEDIQKLTDIYKDHGYAYANVTPNSDVDPDKRVVNLDLQVERGDLVYIGRIEFVGNTRTRDKVIRREMRLLEGDLYNATKINASKARIYQLGFFETVNITTKQGASPDLMDINIEVKERSTGSFQIGAGFSSVERFIATAQISHNNFLGNGQSLSLSAQLSFGQYARQLATLQFFDPYFLDSLWSLGMNAYITQRYYLDFQRNSTGFAPSLGYLITPDIRFSMGYTLENIQISTNLLPSGGADLNDLTRDGLNSAINASLSYDTRDNRLFPSSGMYHVLSGEFSDKALGSNPGLAYRRLEIFTRYYFPLPLMMVLKLNAQLGWVFSPGGRSVPISERFFPGGIYSVRGFQPRGLGPVLFPPGKGVSDSGTTPFAIGGNKQAILNVEMEFPVIPPAGIKGVVFADAGNAYNDDQNLFYVGDTKPKAYLMHSNREISPPLGLFYSFGFGLRWFSPIGPLRFEWGIPITKRAKTDRSMIFEFTIGNLF